MSTQGTKKYSRYYTYIAPVMKSPMIRSYATPILTMATLSVFIIFAIKPTLETIAVLQKKHKDSQDILVKINEKSKSLSEAQEAYKVLDPNAINKVQQAVPPSVELRSIIQTLEDVASKNQASISAMQFEPILMEQRATESTTFTLTEIPFTFNVEGPYSRLTKMLQDLKSSNRVITIDTLVFNKGAESSILLMSVSGKAYYLK